MIRINLLPIDVEVEPLQLNPAIVMAVPTVILIGILMPFNFSQMRERTKLEEKKAALNSKLERYQPILKQVEALEAAQNQLKQRKNVIEQLQSERLRYPEFM